MINNMIPWRRTNRKLSVRNEPVNTVSAIQSEINRMFDRYFDDSFGLAPFRSMLDDQENFFPTVDVSEDEKQIKVTVDLPGVDEKDIDISLHHNVLEIRGEKKFEKEEKEENYHYVERSYGSFHRSLQLPSEVDGDNVEAACKNGVLTVSLPKIENSQRKRIAVKSR